MGPLLGVAKQDLAPHGRFGALTRGIGFFWHRWNIGRGVGADQTHVTAEERTIILQWLK